MRRILLIFLLSLVFKATFAQTPSPEEKLYYTCKVWGFVKYYHSEVSVCHVNWDSVLLHVLPMVRASSTSADFNDALDTMLLAAGPMALSSTPLAPITDPILKCNLDHSWISSTVLRSDVQEILDTIKNNFRPHAMCQVNFNPGSGGNSWGGYLEFPPDTVMLNTDMYTTYPGQDDRLLMLFKLWNMVRYFNPYNYVLTTSWDTTLYHYAVPFEQAASRDELSSVYFKITTALDDAHVNGLSYFYYTGNPPGNYPPQLVLKYVEGQYTVVRSKVAGITAGDVIKSVDGLSVAQWEDSLMKYYSAGSIEIKHRTMASNMLKRASSGLVEMITCTDSTGTDHTIAATTVYPYSSTAMEDFFYDYYYPADTMKYVGWSVLGCDVGYMNYGSITDAGTDSAYDAMWTLPAIVLDIRNYPSSGTAWALSDKLLNAPTVVTKLSMPDVTYPGTYTWKYVSMGYSGNPMPYAGKIVIIVDEQTQSAAEYTTMMTRAYPNTTVIGGHTAGADGNVTYMQPSLDSRFGWTSLGVYYPNGDSTQRIGIVPNVLSAPTIEGVRHHRDYVLEQALSIAGCDLHAGVKPVLNTNPRVSVFPNPANDAVTINAANVATGAIEISITDVSGKILVTDNLNNTGKQARATLNISSLTPGLYFVRVRTGDQNFVTKLVKE